MFEAFFYTLREQGVPISATSFLQLQKALAEGLITGLDDFYVVARALLVKKVRHFDLYDRVFAHSFQGKELLEPEVKALEEDLRRTLLQWLKEPEFLQSFPEDERDKLAKMSPDDLVQYFMDRLADQTEEHHGGNRWIGTGGTSPVGHSGYHPGGMRVGGESRNQSAVKVAMDRRYIDYAADSLLTGKQMGEALRTLRDMAPVGPRDELNIDESIRATVKQAGEIELVFDRRLRDKLSVFLFVDNGGWSMYPYIERTRALFTHARDVFRQIRTFHFHNCVYDRTWEDPQRHRKPVALDELLRADVDTRVIFIGDASMAPYELMSDRGSIDYMASYYQRQSGFATLSQLANHFSHVVWVNPIRAHQWGMAHGRYTIRQIRSILPMVDLTLTGIEQAVGLLK
jgi:uncharacterized protein